MNDVSGAIKLHCRHLCYVLMSVYEAVNPAVSEEASPTVSSAKLRPCPHTPLLPTMFSAKPPFNRPLVLKHNVRHLIFAHKLIRK